MTRWSRSWRTPRLLAAATLCLVLGCVLWAGNAAGQEVKCSELTEGRCYEEVHCNWDDKSSRCVSALPCALETSDRACSFNTWDCVWKSGACSVRDAPSGGDTACAKIKAQTACVEQKRCLWSSKNGCSRKPTIILSLADDLSWNDVSWHNIRARSPVLERLMKKEGVELDRFYTSRTCAPSRAMLLSGIYPWETGLHAAANLNPAYSIRCGLPLEWALLPELLKHNAGYMNHAVGKWHLGMHSRRYLPIKRGFDSFVGILGGSVDRHIKPGIFMSYQCACPGKRYGTCKQFYSKKSKRQCTQAINMIRCSNATESCEAVLDDDVSEDATDLFYANEAKKIIERANLDDPLFLYLSWAAPHQPVHAPLRFIRHLLGSVPPFGTDAPLNRACSSSARIEALAMVGVMDEAHRIVIDALERTGRYSDSIFVFMSDNGGNAPRKITAKKIALCGPGSNYPLRGAKFSWMEGGIRSIAFVSSFRYIEANAKGSVYSSLIAINDIMRTIQSSVGITHDDRVPSQSLDHWSRISGKEIVGKDAPPVRSNLPLQIFPQKNQYVLLYYSNQTLWKLIIGNPFTGLGPGVSKKIINKYGHSDIFVPWELPASEVTINPSNGFKKMYMCAPQCLFNLDEDPSEFYELSNIFIDVRKEGREIINDYAKTSKPAKQTNVCDPGFYMLSNKDTTDGYAIQLANSCGVYLPWIATNNQVESMCSKRVVAKIVPAKEIQQDKLLRVNWSGDPREDKGVYPRPAL